MRFGIGVLDQVSIGETIRALLEERDWSASELARRAGVSQSRISRVMSGETASPNLELVEKVAEAFDVPVSTLLGRQPPTVQPEPPTRMAVPIVQVPAHAGIDWTWEPTGQTVTIEENTAKGRALIAIRVEGDCMLPDVAPGDIVLVDQWSRTPKDGDMVVVTKDSQPHVRWARVPPGRPILLVDNFGRPFPVQDAILEGVVVERRTIRPRRRQWHDLEADPETE